MSFDEILDLTASWRCIFNFYNEWSGKKTKSLKIDKFVREGVTAVCGLQRFSCARTAKNAFDARYREVVLLILYITLLGEKKLFWVTIEGKLVSERIFLLNPFPTPTMFS